MRRVDLFAGLALFAFAAFYFWQSLAVTVGFASDTLGPTFFPRLLALGLAILALVVVVRAATNRSDPSAPAPLRHGLLVVLLVLIVAWAVLLPLLGYFIVTPPLLAAVMLLLGLRNLWKLLGTTLGLTLALYLLFGQALNVPLPMGPLGGR
ncbi:MAG: tripartite tricarboxylate transporter TctB family protein [Gemmatimonadetes bacterium]|nr:tripartite tricarboxylate transporter TctB family protein [Gemmatimonadota bacterium]